MSVGD